MILASNTIWQTGDLTLAGVGLLLIIIGLVRRRRP